MDLDPNYDPSDFLKMPSTSQTIPSHSQHQNDSVNVEYAMNISIKQEPQSTQQQTYEQQSFDMSEMLLYQQKTIDESQIQLEQQDEFPPDETQSQATVQPVPHHQHHENIDDVGIHDDLAISDSDEGDQDMDESKRDQADSENGNENDNNDDGGGLWF